MGKMMMPNPTPSPTPVRIAIKGRVAARNCASPEAPTAPVKVTMGGPAPMRPSLGISSQGGASAKEGGKGKSAEQEN
jgi:hypothetical protein